MMTPTDKPRRGFTLVELLVVIGIIALLISILLPAVTRARKLASETRSLSNLRQMLYGYTAYYTDNRGWVLWGYTPPAGTVNGATVVAYDPVSKQDVIGQPAYRYPWRLARYCGNIWSIIHSHVNVMPPLTQPGDTAAVVASKAYELSLNPTYGINSVFVGGDYRNDGFPNNQTNVGKYIVFRSSEVRHPTDLIVFADCYSPLAQGAGVTDLVGFHTLTPPHAGGGVQWTVVDGVAKSAQPYQIVGLPHGWYTRHVVTGFFDGHAEALPPDRLTDMRLWANDATTPDYDYK